MAQSTKLRIKIAQKFVLYILLFSSFTDMTMPKMTGDALAAELMAIRPDIPVIICTGYSKKIFYAKAKEMGIKAFAYKPIIKADLAITVRKVLDETKGPGHP